jgi:hypothetical protein
MVDGRPRRCSDFPEGFVGNILGNVARLTGSHLTPYSQLTVGR